MGVCARVCVCVSLFYVCLYLPFLSNKCLALCIALCPFTLPSTASSRLTLPLARGPCTALAVAASVWLACRPGHPIIILFLKRTIFWCRRHLSCQEQRPTPTPSFSRISLTPTPPKDDAHKSAGSSLENSPPQFLQPVMSNLLLFIIKRIREC